MNNIVLIKTLIGSHNYNINDENSDKDYKQFVLPTFDDLYEHKVKSSTVTKMDGDIDIETKDVRLLVELLKKANPAYLEIMFSKEVTVHALFQPVWRFIESNREHIVRFNLKNLINASVGMMYQKHSNFKKCTASTQHLCDKFGYDTKNFCHLMRIAYLLRDYYTMGYSDYHGKLSLRSAELLDIKHGSLGYDDAVLLADSWLTKSNQLKDQYNNTDEEIKLHNGIFTVIDQMIKDLIKRNLV